MNPTIDYISTEDYWKVGNIKVPNNFQPCIDLSSYTASTIAGSILQLKEDKMIIIRNTGEFPAEEEELIEVRIGDNYFAFKKTWNIHTVWRKKKHENYSKVKESNKYFKACDVFISLINSNSNNQHDIVINADITTEAFEKLIVNLIKSQQSGTFKYISME